MKILSSSETNVITRERSDRGNLVWRFFGIASLSLAMTVLLAGVAFAAPDAPTYWPVQLVPPQCAATGDCSICDMFTVLMNVARWIFALGGGGALKMVIYGAGRWATSAGNSEHIDEGRKAIFAAIVGIVIILVAWQLVYFVMATLTNPGFNQPLTGTLLKSWYAPPCGTTP